MRETSICVEGPAGDVGEQFGRDRELGAERPVCRPWSRADRTRASASGRARRRRTPLAVGCEVFRRRPAGRFLPCRRGRRSRWPLGVAAVRPPSRTACGRALPLRVAVSAAEPPCSGARLESEPPPNDGDRDEHHGDDHASAPPVSWASSRRRSGGSAEVGRLGRAGLRPARGGGGLAAARRGRLRRRRLGRRRRRLRRRRLRLGRGWLGGRRAAASPAASSASAVPHLGPHLARRSGPCSAAMSS